MLERLQYVNVIKFERKKIDINTQNLSVWFQLQFRLKNRVPYLTGFCYLTGLSNYPGSRNSKRITIVIISIPPFLGMENFNHFSCFLTFSEFQDWQYTRDKLTQFD